MRWMSYANFVWLVIKRSLLLTPVALTLTDNVASVGSIRGRSMQPTLNPEGFFLKDRVLLGKFNSQRYKYERGQVVIFRSPEEPRVWLVKRVVAIQGDWVTLPETYDITQVPKGHCWVEGDNQLLSHDSRDFGPIPLALLTGRVSYVVWPPARVGKVECKVPQGRILYSKPS